jgi:hypothetical protein
MLDWLIGFLSGEGLLVVWVDAQAVRQDFYAALERHEFVVEDKAVRDFGAAARRKTASQRGIKFVPKGCEMTPLRDVRRKVIPEWMALPRDRRQTWEQASAFAVKAVETHMTGRGGDGSYRRIMTWLSPRIGKA